jgi:hypothetical protein
MPLIPSRSTVPVEWREWWRQNGPALDRDGRLVLLRKAERFRFCAYRVGRSVTL